MEQVINAGRIRGGSQRFFLGKDEISGVQNATISYTNNIVPIKSIGSHGKCLITSISGPQQGDVQVSAYLIGPDPFIKYTGDFPIDGYLLKDRDIGTNYGFTSGYLTDYNANFAVGEVPTVDASFTVLGDAGRIESGDYTEILSNLEYISTGDETQFDFKVPTYGSIGICFDDIHTNRLLACSVGISTSRNPIYILGSRYPQEVKQNYPIEINCNFTFDKNDYEGGNLRDEVCPETVKNLSIKVRDEETDSLIQSYCFEDLFKIGETQSTSIGDNTKINASYRGWIFDYVCTDAPIVICPGYQEGKRNDIFGPLEFSVIDDTSAACITVTGQTLTTGFIPQTGIHIERIYNEDCPTYDNYVYVEPFSNTTGCGWVRLSADDGKRTGYCDFQICLFDDLLQISEIPDKEIHVLAHFTVPEAFTVTHEDEDFDFADLELVGTSLNPFIIPDENIHIEYPTPPNNFTVDVTGGYMTGNAQIRIDAYDGFNHVYEHFYVNVINSCPTIERLASQDHTINMLSTGIAIKFEVDDLELGPTGVLLVGFSQNDGIIDGTTGIIFEGTSSDRIAHLFTNYDHCQQTSTRVQVFGTDQLCSGSELVRIFTLNAAPIITSLPDVIINKNESTGVGLSFLISDEFLDASDLGLLTGIERVDDDASITIPNIFLIGNDANRSLLIQTSAGTGIYDFEIDVTDGCATGSDGFRIEINEDALIGAIDSISWVFDEIGFTADGQAGAHRYYEGDPTAGGARISPWSYAGEVAPLYGLRFDIEDAIGAGCDGTNGNIQTGTATGVITVVDEPITLNISWGGEGETFDPEPGDDPNDSTQYFEQMEMWFNGEKIGRARAPGGGLLDCSVANVISEPPAGYQKIYLPVGENRISVHVSTVDANWHKNAFYQFDFEQGYPKERVLHESGWSFFDEGLIDYQPVPAVDAGNYFRNYVYIEDSGKFYSGEFSSVPPHSGWKLDDNPGVSVVELPKVASGIPWDLEFDENFFSVQFNPEQGVTCGDVTDNPFTQSFKALNTIVLNDEYDLVMRFDRYLSVGETSGLFGAININGTGVGWCFNRVDDIHCNVRNPGIESWTEPQFTNGVAKNLGAGIYNIEFTGMSQKVYSELFEEELTAAVEGDYVKAIFQFLR